MITDFAFMHRRYDDQLGFVPNSFLLEWLDDGRERRHWIDLPVGVVGVMFEVPVGLVYETTQQMVYPTHVFRRLDDDSWIFLEFGLVGILSESEAAA